MEPPTNVNFDGLGEDNVDLIRGLMANDPEFTSLTVSAHCEEYEDEGDNRYDAALGGMDVLGRLIGQNSILKHFMMRLIGDNDVSLQKLEPLLRGLNKNKSITDLEFDHTDIMGGLLFKKLLPFFRNNHDIERLKVDKCEFDENAGMHLARALSECPSKVFRFIKVAACELEDDATARIIAALGPQPRLKMVSFRGNCMDEKGCLALGCQLEHPGSTLAYLDLSKNEIGDDAVQVLANALLGNKELKQLNLSRNHISNNGFQALSNLLGGSRCNLSSLDISGNTIDNATAVIFAKGLADNSKLTKLTMFRGHITDRNGGLITDSGWSALSRLLCDTSSVNKTFLSNHNITSLGYGGFSSFDDDSFSMEDPWPSDVAKGLEINGNIYKSNILAGTNQHSARKKIMMVHFSGESVQPLIDVHVQSEMLPLLPHVIGWAAKHQTINSENDSFSLLYHFVRAMPSSFDVKNVIKNGYNAKKRKFDVV